MNNFAAHFGIKCSSFCKVNIGTSMRSACTSLGFTEYVSVWSSNKLLERNPEPLTICKRMCIESSMLKYKGRGTYMHACMVVSCQTHRVARTCTLVLLCTALGGAWSLEQPSGSLLEFYPTWRFIMNMVCNSGGPQAVISLDFRFLSWLENSDMYRALPF